MIWHSQDIDSVLSELRTDAKSGLASDEAALRLQEHGKNTVAHSATPSLSFLLPYFFGKTSICLLVLAALWTIVAVIWKTVSFIEPAVLVAFVLLKGTVLSGLAFFGRIGIHSFFGGQKPTATVLRDGENKEILCEALVPGDIILLKKGDLVPADCRLISSHTLHCDEEALHDGHSQTEKTADAIGIPDIAPIAERHNMLYMGSAVTDGVATAVVTDTGAATELGKRMQTTGTADANLLSVGGDITKLRRFAVLVSGLLCILLLLASILHGIFVGTSFWGNLLFWLTVAVCVPAAFLPDGNLPGLYFLCYMKLRQMRKNKIAINRLQTLDKLNRVSVICCDKTGCITKSGRMELQQVYDGSSVCDVRELNESAARVLHLAALCCDGEVEQLNRQEKRNGDSTQTAIISAALKQLKLTMEDLRVAYPRMSALPFDRELKTMCTVNMIGGNHLAIVRGAPDKILPMCTHVDADAVAGVQMAMASRALRVIAVAVKPLDVAPTNPTRAELECNLQFVGLLGLYNPPRKDARSAVELCRNNGMKTIMLTGDDLENASAYARSLGILTADTEAIDQAALSELTDAQLAEVINRYTVFSGVSGDSKTRIVKALQSAGHTVLMTGDAIEDIAALRAADVGCTPAGLGTDIAKHTCDLVASGGLAAIVASIFHVRHLYHSIQSVYRLLCGLGITLFLWLFLSVFTGHTLSFAQILLSGLFACIGLPLYFGFTRSTLRSPQQKSTVLWQTIAMFGICIAALVSAIALPGDTDTLLFSTLMSSYALLAYRISLACEIHKNPRYAAIHFLPALGFILLLVLLSFIAPVFGFIPLILPVWLLVIVFACVGTIAYMGIRKICK